MQIFYAFNIRAKIILNWLVLDKKGYGMLKPTIVILVVCTVLVIMCHWLLSASGNIARKQFN